MMAQSPSLSSPLVSDQFEQLKCDQTAIAFARRETFVVLLLVAFYALACNVVFWSASRMVGIAIDGWFGLEYCGVGLLALLQRRIISAVALALVFILDIGAGISLTYGIPAAQVIANFRAVEAFSWYRIVGAATVLVLACILLILAWRIPVVTLHRRARAAAAGCLSCFILVSLSIDYAATARRLGHLFNPVRIGFHAAPDWVDHSYFDRFRPSRLPSIRLVRAELNQASIRAKAAATYGGQAQARSAFAASMGSIGNLDSRNAAPLPDIVLVVVESWGLARDPAVNDSLTAAYRPLQDSGQYRIATGTVPFFGVTVAGEGRELCASRIGYGIEDASAQQLKDCVPNRLAALGYATIAVHGMDGRFFNRSRWYRTAGFQRLIFKSDFRRQGLPDCLGAFIGSCDAGIAGWISAALADRSEQPRFIYWLTLNSHLPVLAPSSAQQTNCAAIAGVRGNGPLCSWFDLVGIVHHSLARVAASATRPTLFVIVGDHAPPFLDMRTRARFSSSDVPYLLLIPPAGSRPGELPDRKNPAGLAAALSEGRQSRDARLPR
jgi:hypothetical protein